MNEFSLDKDYMKGDAGPYIWIIQEWLCIHGINIVIDGSFGPATETAIRKFQIRNNLPDTGIADAATYSLLIQPLTTVLKPIPAKGLLLREMVILLAKQHLEQHPVEVGSRNMGPWIRYYMRGYQGASLPWSAGFVSSILRQASENCSVELNIKLSDTFSGLANSAKKCGAFLSERAILADKTKLMPGFIFLSREFPGYWTHAGIVSEVDNEVFYSIEGNTNDDGSAEGYEVCRRIRNYDGKDFIIV